MQLRSSFILIIHLLHSGGVGGGDGIPEQEHSCIKKFIYFEDFSSCSQLKHFDLTDENYNDDIGI